MEVNVGGVDRTVRIILGIVLLSLFFVLEGNARWWGLIGVGLLATGIFRFCPAYLPFGIKTCATKR
ncbi:MAG: DUF2892 domain-containing protein [Burkholderiales bacterium]|jgi:Protein of unknown function (DUF2892)|nr:DUF2892 domain-containing protein [Burkholderiales bacterium]MBP8007008.1 DUF2892 domain-containing protein [Burkholderiales bacterium]